MSDTKTNFSKPKRKRSTLGDGPPDGKAKVIQNLHKTSSAEFERVHFLMRPEAKRELKMWGVMHDKDMTEIILEGLALWKERHIH